MGSNVLFSFAAIVRENHSLAPFTWLQIGGPTRYLIEPNDQKQLIPVDVHSRQSDYPSRLVVCIN